MTVRFDRFVFDSGQRVVLDGDRVIRPSARLFDVLAVLMEHAPDAVNKNTLAEQAWPDSFPGDGSIAQAINELRALLGDDGTSQRIIRTIPKFGYAVAVAVERSTPASGARISPRFWLTIAGRTVPLAPGETTVGRDPASTVPLDSDKVSRTHARLLVDAQQATLEDVSFNGTWVGGQRVTRQVALRHGDELLFADVPATFHSSETARQAKTRPLQDDRRR